MSDSTNFPAPYFGVDNAIPVAQIKNPYCESLINFNTVKGGLSLKKGDSKYSRVGNAAGGFDVECTATLNDTIAWAYGFNLSTARPVVIDLDTGTETVLVANNRTIGIGSSMSFNNFQYFFATDQAPAGQAPGFAYNATAGTYGACGYTGTGLAPIAGNVYNNRNYIIQYNTPDYWYSEINATSGALTKVSLSSGVVFNGTLSAIASVSISDSSGSTKLQCFVFSTGEILFYTGTYPDSLTDWTLLARAKVGAPLNYNSGMEYQGDYLLFCDSGIVSLRDLFLRGSQDAVNLSVNSKINRAWIQHVRLLRESFGIPSGPVAQCFGVYDTKTSRVVIYLAGTVTAGVLSTSVGTFYVFDTINKAWSIHTSAALAQGVLRFKNKIIYSLANGTAIMSWQKEESSGFMNRNAGDTADATYTYEMISAPVPTPKTAVYTIEGVEAIMQSDLYATTNWNLIAEFGRQTTTDQIVDAITTSIQKPMINMGIIGNYVQVKMSGTTAASKTVGLDLYGYNVWYDAGQKGSR